MNFYVLLDELWPSRKLYRMVARRPFVLLTFPPQKSIFKQLLLNFFFSDSSNEK